MFKKRGQAAIFLVVLVILTIATIMLLYFQRTSNEGIKTESEKVLSVEDQNVQNFVQDCVDLTAKNGIFYLGYVGGRLKPDAFSYYSFDSSYKVPYFYIEGRNAIPLPYDERYWTGLLNRYFNNYFESCIDGFATFPVEIEHGPLNPVAKFTDTSVVFEIDYPATILRDFQEINIPSKYTTTVPVRLRQIAQIATTIVEKEVRNDLYIHWDYLTQVTGHNYDITAYTEQDSTIIYRVTDLQNKIDDENYKFQFANKII